ncbi:hypothetical protein CASFOL_015307 [Castilleja foliolosa]|uniref:Uncharacterized protein n=1 Tax=Castilleja foliolosa TaxID=1961234 RepID=A0ABD3DGR5_9LAMI
MGSGGGVGSTEGGDWDEADGQFSDKLMLAAVGASIDVADFGGGGGDSMMRLRNHHAQGVTYYERVHIPRRITHRTRDLSNRVYASDEARDCAIKKAEEKETTLGSEYPSFVRSMLPSHVSGFFWL